MTAFRSMHRNVWLSGALTLLCLTTAHAQRTFDEPLPRRGFLGASLTVAPEGVDQGVLIQHVFPESSAADAELRAGDVILSINGIPTEAPRSTASFVGRMRAGDRLQVTVIRDGAPLDVGLSLRPRPMEESDDLEVVYDDVQVGDHRLRTIILKPEGDGPFPAVLFLQGLSCSSIDYAFSPGDPVRHLVYGMTERGFVTMRVEKSGVGDSEGPDCTEIGIHEEAEGFRAALHDLRTLDFVDVDRLYLFGHSMGGVIAPIIARDQPVSGVIVYGTIGKPFIEYMVENHRRQAVLDGGDQVAIDASIRSRLRFMHYFYFDDLPASEILAAHPDLEMQPTDFGLSDDTHQFGRHVRFFRELSGMNLAEHWSRLEAHVLAIHGEYDWVSTEEDHAIIAQVVNARHPGTARWISLDGMDHGFLTYSSLEESYVNRRSGPFDPVIVDTATEWMTGVAANRGRASSRSRPD